MTPRWPIPAFRHDHAGDLLSKHLRYTPIPGRLTKIGSQRRAVVVESPERTMQFFPEVNDARRDPT